MGEKKSNDTWRAFGFYKPEKYSSGVFPKT